MGNSAATLSGPDFTKGFPLKDLKDGSMLLGQAQGEAVILVRRGDEASIVGAFCTHYGGPLVEGIVTAEGIHCPWHHSCFSLKTGAPLSPPGLNALTVWETRMQDGVIYATGKKKGEEKAVRVTSPKTMVILGGGAAGQVAAETLRQEGFDGRIVLVTLDSSLPYDRPNLSKDYLAGNAPEEWIPLRSPDFYSAQAIETKVSRAAVSLDVEAKILKLSSGETLSYDALTLATGAQPVRLELPGGDLPHVRYLRTLADSRALIERAKSSKGAVVIGAGFIGLEVAASLRARNIPVTVVGMEAIPLERALGPELGAYVKRVHEEHGVEFRLGVSPKQITENSVGLSNGSRIPADLVVIGVGVKPAVEVASASGLAVDNGILVNEYLETSSPGIFAAGDVARYPDPLTRERVRIEHWVLAQRHGKIAALNMLGRKMAFTAVPFFWSNHYDLSISFTGRASRDSKIEIHGSLEARDCLIAYRHQGRITAVATIGRDQKALMIEEALARQDFEAVERMI